MTPILFLMAYALGLVGTFWRPQIGVYMYVTIYFLNPLDRWWGASIPSLRYGFMIAVAALISFVLHGYLSRLKEVLLHPVMFVWGMLVGWHYLITLWALNGPLHAYYSLQMLTVYVIGTVAACVLDTVERVKIMLTVFVFGAFYIGYLGYSKGRGGGGRLEGIGTPDAPDSNDFAAMIAAICPILCYMALFGSRVQKVIAILAMPFILNVLVLINSRGSFLGLVAGSSFLIWTIMRSREVPAKVRRQIYAGLVAGVLAFAYLADAVFWERMGTIIGVKDETGQQQERDGSAASRLFFWKVGMELAPQYPLGGGIHAFGYLSKPYLPEEYQGKTSRGRAAHSIWVETLTETGIPGLTIYLLLVFVAYRSYKRALRNSALYPDKRITTLCNTLIASLVVCLVSFTFLDRLRAEIFYWVCTFIACLDLYLRSVVETKTRSPSSSLTDASDAPPGEGVIAPSAGGVPINRPALGVARQKERPAENGANTGHRARLTYGTRGANQSNGQKQGEQASNDKKPVRRPSIYWNK